MQEGGFLIQAVEPGQSVLQLQSVGLVLVDNFGRYFAFQELKPKWQIGKACNNWSFGWETREAGESDAAVLARILPEEVGERVVLASQPQLLTVFEFANSCANFYWARFGHAYSFDGAAVRNGEIKNPGWKTPTCMNSLICRVGIRWVLSKLREQNIGQWT